MVLLLLIGFLILDWLLFGIPIHPVSSRTRHGSSLRSMNGRVARRQGALARVDLSKRRRWYADDDDDSGDDNNPPPNDNGIDFNTLDPAVRAYIDSQKAYISKLNGESQGRRKYIEKMEARLEALETKQVNDAKAQGNYKDLYEAEVQKIAELQAQADKAKEYEAQIVASNEARIGQLPDIWKDTVPELPPHQLSTWLDRFLPKATTPSAPNIGAGTSTGGTGDPKITDDEKAMASRFGMTPEEYLANK